MATMRNRVIGLASSAVAALTLALVFHPLNLPWRSSFALQIASPPFSQLQPGTTVELAGTRVGQVDSLTIEHGIPVLDLHIDGNDARLLHANASATIEPHGLLGTQYVELEAGTQGPFPAGGTIPVSRVHVAVTLNQVLNLLQAPERQNLQTLIDQLGAAAANQGQDVNESLRALGDASDALAQVSSTLRQHDKALATIITSSQQLTGSLQHAPIGAQIDDTNKVLQGLAAVDSSTGHGIDHTATVLSDLNVILHDNAGNLRYTLGRAPRVAAQLRTLLVEANTLVKGINPALPALMTFATEAESAFGGTDANGHYVRVMSVTGSCTAGLNLGCSGYQGGSKSPAARSSGPGGSIPDQQLINLLFGGR
jgi:virulence factor Mce-like protein